MGLIDPPPGSLSYEKGPGLEGLKAITIIANYPLERPVCIHIFVFINVEREQTQNYCVLSPQTHKTNRD